MRIPLLFLSLLWAQGVGIGTTSPTARLHVVGIGNSAASTAFLVQNSLAAPLLVVQDNRHVGIGVATPTQPLHVVGNFQFSGAFRPAGDAGISGYYLRSQGADSPPAWQAVQSGGWILWNVDSWDASNNTTQGWSGSTVTVCQGQYMLGGYGQCGNGCVLSKTFNNLPPHQQVMVEVYYWAVDSWDQKADAGVDYVRLEIDGVPVAYGVPGQVFTPNLGMGWADSSLCGSTIYVDRGPFLLVGRLNHNAPSLTVAIRSMVTQDATDESLGVTAVYLWLR